MTSMATTEVINHSAEGIDTRAQNNGKGAVGDAPSQNNGKVAAEDGTSTPLTAPGGKSSWIRYSVEHRDRDTDELIHRSIHTEDEYKAHKQGNTANGSDGPAFELVTIYKTSRTNQSDFDKGKDSAPPPPLSHPLCALKIYSPAIINALQSIVQYYPGQDLSGDSIQIPWPYPVLVHHYDQLANFRVHCARKDAAALCVRERDADAHIKLLLDFLDENVMEKVREEEERNKKGFETWEGEWVPLKPGVTIVGKWREDDEWSACVVQSVRGGIFSNPPTSWLVEVWKMTYDGTYVGRHLSRSQSSKYDGETESSFKIIRDQAAVESTGDEVAVKLIEHGETYWKLLKKQCKYHKGKTTEFPYNEVNGLVMVDIKTFYTENPAYVPSLMDKSDCRNWTSDCICLVCMGNKREHDKKLTPLFDEWNDITLEAYDELERHQYLLLPKKIKAFVFRSRTWESVHVSNCYEPEFNSAMIDVLVMDETRVRTLKALAKSFVRIDKNERQIDHEPWTADFVKGKGNGLVFLLHGKPGVGKTCTAECIAEFTNQPLMILTSSDIGTDPVEVEKNLTKNFRKAKSWNAVLLIDEADVFMERRTTADLIRNSLVAGFLRALEHYDGILFLTTNRVGSFDDAFISRVHIQLYYPNFTDEQRQQIWQTFVDKLLRDRGNTMRLTIDAKEYLRSEKVKAVKWNGREIRNAFQTAVALAEYDAEKDEEGKIIVTDNHLRAVVELSKDFKDYMDSLHHGDEGKRAERRHERLDTHGQE